MDTLLHLGAGFSAALSPMNLFMALLGAFQGTLVGVLPGLGPTSAIATIGSFVAGTLGVVGLTFFAPYLADRR